MAGWSWIWLVITIGPKRLKDHSVGSQADVAIYRRLVWQQGACDFLQSVIKLACLAYLACFRNFISSISFGNGAN